MKFCCNAAIAVSSFVFVVDGRDLRFDSFILICTVHPLQMIVESGTGVVERLREEYPENVFASAFELPALSALASLVFQNQGLQVF